MNVFEARDDSPLHRAMKEQRMVPKGFDWDGSIQRACDKVAPLKDRAMATSLTPLHVAAMLDLADTLKSLLQRPEVDINAQDSMGRTPLWYAAESWELDCAHLLLAVPGIDAGLASYGEGPPKREAGPAVIEEVQEKIDDAETDQVEPGQQDA